MASDVLGRTNLTFPKDWYRLVLPAGSNREDQAKSLIDSAISKGAVVDISTSPALWGGLLRGKDAKILIRGGTEIESAPSETISCDLIQAHLVQSLSAIGREWIDFYFLQVRHGLSEQQINGALMALENARQEGHIRHLGIECLGKPEEVLQLWIRHDAFEVAIVHSLNPLLISFATDRRVGVITDFDSDFTTLRPLATMEGASA